jgi:polyphosphate kinase 2
MTRRCGDEHQHARVAQLSYTFVTSTCGRAAGLGACGGAQGGLTMKKQKAAAEAASAGAVLEARDARFRADGRLARKEYERILEKLHVELVKLQMWVQKTGAKVCIVFEGRDGAGKGGTIKAITERVSPRVFRVVALPAPTEREKSQLYVQRYIQHMPAAGEIVIFDRSWYNRAGVEKVMGFATDKQVERFLQMVPAVEKAYVDSGIILLKYWLEVSPEEQTRRLEARIDDGRKLWKLTPMDLKSYSRWYDYSRARDAMFLATDTAWAPWFVADSNDKKRARLNIIRHLLRHIPYEAPKREKVRLPKRQKADGYETPEYAFKPVPDTLEAAGG